MKQGDTIPYNGASIQRLKNKGERQYRAVHRVRIPDPNIYTSKQDAKKAIDGAIAWSQIRRQERAEKRGFAEVGSFVEYRGKKIERVEDAKDGAKRYRVDGMGRGFKSIDIAVRRIDQAHTSLERLENPPTSDASGNNRNLEK